MSKTGDFITKEFDTIIKDSREYKAYELGMASGYFQLYKYIEVEFGEQHVKKQFESFIKGTERMYEYFRKLIELDEESKTDLKEGEL